MQETKRLNSTIKAKFHLTLIVNLGRILIDKWLFTMLSIAVINVFHFEEQNSTWSDRVVIFWIYISIGYFWYNPQIKSSNCFTTQIAMQRSLSTIRVLNLVNKNANTQWLMVVKSNVIHINIIFIFKTHTHRLCMDHKMMKLTGFINKNDIVHACKTIWIDRNVDLYVHCTQIRLEILCNLKIKFPIRLSGFE